MKSIKTLIPASLGLLGLASACTVDTDVTAEDVATGEAATCQNEEGVNATMAALAAATAKEIRRWLPGRDFTFNNTTGKLELTSHAYPRCPNRQCKNVQAILDFQKPEANGKIVFKGGAVLNSEILRERLRSAYDRQIICNTRPDNHAADYCPTEYHDLTFSHTVAGGCETDYWFHATKQNSSALLQYPAQLKNQLLWVGYQPGGGGNPYLAFDAQGDDVKIDPTGGPVEGDPAASGSCPAVCNKYSVTNIANGCCSCNGVTKKFAPLTGVANIYICQ